MLSTDACGTVERLICKSMCFPCREIPSLIEGLLIAFTNMINKVCAACRNKLERNGTCHECVIVVMMVLDNVKLAHDEFEWQTIR